MKIYEVKQLEGTSGCLVQLFRTDRSTFVRKLSRSPSYNARLEEQCRKQHFYVAQAGVRAPLVRTWGYKEGLFYFDMEYIPGRTLAELIPIMKSYDVSPYIDLLFRVLHWTEAGRKSDARQAFGIKLFQLENILSSKIFDGKIPAKVFSMLKSFDWNTINETPCHGDLTMDNMIVAPNGRICMLDFLDVFYNSWMIDVARLLQDMDLHWSFRKVNLTDIAIHNLNAARNLIVEKISSSEGGKDKIKAIYYLLLLNVLSMWAEPHAETEEQWLSASLVKVMEIIDKDCR